MLSAEANRGEEIAFEIIRGSKVADIDNSREPRNGRAKANVSEDLPMTERKIELEAGSLGVFLSSLWRSAELRRSARIPEDCRVWIALPANHRQNLRR